jgi:hypothetical protein
MEPSGLFSATGIDPHKKGRVDNEEGETRDWTSGGGLGQSLEFRREVRWMAPKKIKILTPRSDGRSWVQDTSPLRGTKKKVAKRRADGFVEFHQTQEN